MADRAVAVIVQDDKILLVHRHKKGRDFFVLPGGGVEPGETPEQACVREAKEETGLSIVLQRKLRTQCNNVRVEHYSLATITGGTLCLGYPEAARQSSDNRYTLEWVDIAHLATINLQPADVRDIVALQRDAAVYGIMLDHSD